MEIDEKRLIVGAISLRIGSLKISSQLHQKGYRFKSTESEDLCQGLVDSTNLLFSHGLVEAKVMETVKARVTSIINSQVEKIVKRAPSESVVVIDHDEEAL
jgi:hypothetical protein